jgi:hypothetical protein
MLVCIPKTTSVSLAPSTRIWRIQIKERTAILVPPITPARTRTARPLRQAVCTAIPVATKQVFTAVLSVLSTRTCRTMAIKQRAVLLVRRVVRRTARRIRYDVSATAVDTGLVVCVLSALSTRTPQVLAMR